MDKNLWIHFVLLIAAVPMLGVVSRAQEAPAKNPVPVVDGALGSCAVDFTVKDDAGAPVYNAKIRVHISYGFLGAHKLDLEVGTNSDGKAQFTGLPNKSKLPLYFNASQGDREGTYIFDPAKECKTQRTVVLQKAPAAPAQ